MQPSRHRADSCNSDSCRQHSLNVPIGGDHYHLDWRGCIYRVSAFILLLPYLILTWWLFSPWSGAWSTANTAFAGKGPLNLNEYFHSFSGSTECGSSLSDLYLAPRGGIDGKLSQGSFCPNRETLLAALSGGGRHGFDAPYTPRGCHYRWYTTDEMCMILERFDSLVFIGDDSLETIYSGLNILIRKDLALGSLNPSELSADDRQNCRCENQFVKDSCSKKSITSSDQVRPSDAGHYICSRTRHAFLPITSSPFSPSTLKSLNTLIPRAPPSNYHPIPIITSLTPSNQPNTPLATQTLSDLLTFADSTARKTPVLWVGPLAAGHMDIRGRVSNNEMWRFSREMERVAREKDVETLGMWNMTVQAASWDGRRFGERVAVVQAMMVVNWLSRLESS